MFFEFSVSLGELLTFNGATRRVVPRVEINHQGFCRGLQIDGMFCYRWREAQNREQADLALSQDGFRSVYAVHVNKKIAQSKPDLLNPIPAREFRIAQALTRRFWRVSGL